MPSSSITLPLMSFTGGPLTEEEQSLADVLMPDKVWDYNCCRIDETDSVPGFPGTVWQNTPLK